MKKDLKILFDRLSKFLDLMEDQINSKMGHTQEEMFNCSVDEFCDYLNKLKKRMDIIYVPDSIKISKGGNGLFGLFSKGIVFNHGKQELHVKFQNSGYYVSDIGFDTIKCKLIKCKRSDLRTGDVAFRTHIYNQNYLISLSGYCIILNETDCVYVNPDSKCRGYEILICSDKYDCWYKVEEL